MKHFRFSIGLFWALIGPFLLPGQAGASAFAQPTKPGTTWVYQRTVETTGGAVHRASVHSPTVLDLGYPYGRGAVASLTLRHKNGDTSVYVEVAKGQLNRSFQNGTARVRFDGHRVRSYPLTAAANGRANIVFVDADRSFIEFIKRAKRMTVELVFDGQVNRQIDFPVATLRWPH